jgi:RNA-directed DNA polymerase
VSQPGLQGKSHDIPKRLIWVAWLKVKSNGGAAGAEGGDDRAVRVEVG